MVVQVSKARTAAPVVVARSVRVTPMAARPAGNGVAAGSAATRPATTDAAGSAAKETGQLSTPEDRDRVRAAASVMGWVLWILLALTMAAFLAFAPSML